jgi:hypothetical protein
VSLVLSQRVRAAAPPVDRTPVDPHAATVTFDSRDNQR